MALNKIAVNNFSVFKNFKVDLCDGINIFIGENGTGKTHLLKIMYSFCEFIRTRFIEDPPAALNSFEAILLNNFQEKYFNSLIHNIANNTNPAEIDFDFTLDSKLYEYHIYVSVKKKEHTFPSFQQSKSYTLSVFIPAKDMLTHAGLEHDYISRQLPFDKTLIDILHKPGISNLRHLSNPMQTVLNKIEKTIGGKVVYENGKYYIDREKEGKRSFSIEAEGFKKFGLIYRLIETGCIREGSILFWDEPEANINPKLIPALVEIMLELERNGVQLFIATHDYYFPKFMETRKSDANKVIYHALSKKKNQVVCESQNDFVVLENNDIITQSIALYNEEVKKVME